MKLFKKKISLFLMSLALTAGLFTLPTLAQEETGEEAQAAEAVQESGSRDTKAENFSQESGIFEISSCINEEYVVDAAFCTVLEKSLGEVQLYQGLDVNQQKFYFEGIDDGLYRISVMNDGQALTVSADGSSLTLTAMDHSSESGYASSQAWIVEDAGSGYVYIGTQDGLYLTMKGRKAYNGAELTLSSRSGRKNQKWKLEKSWVGETAAADTDAVDPYAENGAYRGLTLNLDLYGHTETLTAQMLSEHMTESTDEAGGHQFLLDEEYLASFVQNLADTYDTQDQERKFKTQAGNIITITTGNFGWKLNIDETVSLIKDSICYDGKKTIEPVWSHSVVSVGNDIDLNDIGDSYVEVDLTNQKVWLVKNGKVLTECDCVTGTYGTSRQTPAGAYSIFYMQSPATLTGTGYSSDVTYWMPFNNGIGLHDANWRSTFGGEIYKTNGSHGCINLPTDAAKIIYETVCIGYPVILYE